MKMRASCPLSYATIVSGGENVELICNGTTNNLNWWVALGYIDMPFDITPPEFKTTWYCAYIELPFVIKPPDFMKKEVANHILIDGYQINYELLDTFIYVHGGFTFGITDGKKTIVGWDYNHLGDNDITLDRVISETKNVCKQMAVFEELRGKTLTEKELEQFIISKI